MNFRVRSCLLTFRSGGKKQDLTLRALYALEYNSVGQITRKTERQHDGSELVYDYSYDDRYRLVEVKQNGAVVESYAYDANGNRTSHSSLLRGVVNHTASYVSGDQLAQSGNAVYGYDGNGRLSQKTLTENGETTATQYQYSSTGRLLAVTTADKAITYRHNALGQRVAKLVDGVVTEKYLWQNLTTLLAVYDANDNVKQRFEYGLSHTPVSFTQSCQRYYMQTDHLNFRVRSCLLTFGSGGKKQDLTLRARLWLLEIKG
jgi:YD repeat-containing protein